MPSPTQKRKTRRHRFLLTLFPDQKQEYTVLYMNGFVLVRQWNGGSDRWEVAVWEEDTFIRVHGLSKEHLTNTHDIERQVKLQP